MIRIIICDHYDRYATFVYATHPYKNRMSGKCPENVQNNNIQIPDTVYCPENVPKHDRFRHLEFVWNVSRNCPEFVQDLSKSGICPEN